MNKPKSINIFLIIRQFLEILKVLSRERKKQAFISLQLSILSAFLEITCLFSVRFFLERITNLESSINQSYPNLIQDFVSFFYRLDIIYIPILCTLTFLISAAVKIYTINYYYKTTALITTDLSNKILKNIVSKSYIWHLKTNSNKIKTLLTKDIEQVAITINCIFTLVISILIILFLSIYLCLISPKVMLTTTLTFSLFYIFTYNKAKNILNFNGAQKILTYNSILELLESSAKCIKDIKLNELNEDELIKSFKNQSLKHNFTNVKISTITTTPRFLLECIALTLLMIFVNIILFNDLFLINYLQLISSFLLGLYKIIQPLQQIFSSVGLIQSTSTSINRIKPYINIEKNDNRETKIPTLLKNQKNDDKNFEIEFKNVYFSFNNDENYIVKNLSFKIKEKEKIAIFGASGSGKTTIMDLMMGLLKPSKGHILVNGVDINSNKKILLDWMNSLSHLSQFNYIYYSSIFNNITKQKIKNKKIIDLFNLVCKISSLEEIITRMPQGYETMVGDGGFKLSGGQEQRLALARTLFSNRNNIFLDEPTSSLDKKTANFVMKNILKEFNKSRIICISHDSNQLRLFDRILILKKGELVDEGNIHYLEKESKIFQNMIN